MDYLNEAGDNDLIFNAEAYQQHPFQVLESTLDGRSRCREESSSNKALPNVDPYPSNRRSPSQTSFTAPVRRNLNTAGGRPSLVVAKDVIASMGFSNLMKEFMLGTTAHGLSRVAKATSLTGRLVWSLIFCGAMIAFIVQSSLLVAHYRQYEVTNKLKDVTESSPEFPSVTVCNTNKLRRSAIAESPHRDMLVVDDSITLPYYSECGDDQFRCSNGSLDGVCIPITSKCNRIADCYDSEDENECVCKSSEFKCADNGRCILQDKKCDGTNDCVDGSDEVGCFALVACGKVLDTRQSGSFTSPRYPDLYFDNTDCIFTVDFEDGNTHRFSQLYCGYDIPDAWTSDTEKVIVRFRTDSSRVYGGYKVSYTMVGFSRNENVTGPEDQCNEREFDCYGNATLCINQYKTCDTVEDCLGGYDEDLNCSGKIYTKANVFRDGWYDDYLHISSDKRLFDDFRRNYYQDNRFERVKGERPPDWRGFMTFSSTPDFSDLTNVLKLSKDEVHKYGHQLEDFVLQCTYDEKPCNISQDFYTFQDHMYGNCFKFNHGKDGLPVFHATRPGSNYGLKLTLFLEQSEYISIYGRDAGARVNIVPYDVPSFPFIEGITIKPGTVTSLAIREHVITRLPDPYGDCKGDQNTKQGDNAYSGSDYRYKVEACQDYYLHHKIVQECGCSQHFRFEGIPPCSLLNKTQDLCQQLIHFLFQKNLLDCGCHVPCWDKCYTYTTSQSSWPAEVYLKPLLRSLQSTKRKTRNINDMVNASLNLASLVIYFEKLNYQLTSESKDYSMESLFSDIGGTLGLYIGLSMITVFEFFAFIYEMATVFSRRVNSRRRLDIVA
ncbi:degenerin mec-10-like [Ptychodera flava]|uniref:degenerin mec-10-like n=1 Tax=Ptychodera flava TaxID=63121 RepID=UPI003969F715